jgi:hypothetical protein
LHRIGRAEVSNVSNSTSQTAFSPVRESLQALKAGQESFARFVVDLFNDLEGMRQQLLDVESRLSDQRRQFDTEREQFKSEQRQANATATEPDPALQTKLTELEQDRLALEEELESVRSRAVGMAQTISEQKRQMAEEHAQWTAELRQLRRILDKQATWIAQQTESGFATWPPNGHSPPPAVPPQLVPAARSADTDNWRRASATPTVAAPAAHADPVLGSVLSQFELLQKDVARRRNQNALEHANKSGNQT